MSYVDAKHWFVCKFVGAMEDMLLVDRDPFLLKVEMVISQQDALDLGSGRWLRAIVTTLVKAKGWPYFIARLSRRSLYTSGPSPMYYEFLLRRYYV